MSSDFWFFAFSDDQWQARAFQMVNILLEGGGVVLLDTGTTHGALALCAAAKVQYFIT